MFQVLKASAMGQATCANTVSSELMPLRYKLGALKNLVFMPSQGVVAITFPYEQPNPEEVHVAG